MPLVRDRQLTIGQIYHPVVRAAIISHLKAKASFIGSERSRKSNPKVGLVTSLLFLPLFLWISGSLYRGKASKSAVYAHPAFVSGKIIYLQLGSKGQSVTFAFTRRGAVYTNTQNLARGAWLEEGEQIRVAYDTQNPHNSIVCF